MPDPGTDLRDFFISFNSANRDWAEWIAFELEAAGYTTYFQNWDFAPGSNFVLEMQKAASQSQRTIAVLSPAYLAAFFTQPEWAAALVQDPTSSNRKLVPVRVLECRPSGILAPIVYVDLVGLDEESARGKLLIAAEGGPRTKPGSVPFPKPAKGVARKRAFPGVVNSSPSAAPFPSPAGPLPKAAKKPVAPEPPPAPEFSLVWFALALVAAVLLIAFADRLARLGLVSQIYYVVLVALGLAAAGSLFGTLHSRARYRGKNSWGTLELGGPVVVFALVLIGGWLFAPQPRSFVLTIYVRGADGGMPLRGRGRVMLRLGADPRSAEIGENGTATFLGIPAELRGQEVTVALDAEGFERVGSGKVALQGESADLVVKKRAGRLYGVVADAGGRPVAGATVDVGGLQTVTGLDGRFDLAVVQDQVLVRVLAKGFEPYTENLTPGGNEMTLQLTTEGRPR